MSAILVGLASAPTASAAPPWLAPTNLAAPSTAYVGAPAVAVASDGTTVMAFSLVDGSSSRIYVAVRPAGGSFGPAQALSDPGVNSVSPVVAIDRQGNATAVWVRGGIVQASYKRAGTDWLPGQSLTGDTSSHNPAVAVGDSGAAAVSWVEDNGGLPGVAVALRSAATTSFNPASFVTSGAGSTVYGTPKVAMDGAGDLAVLWQRVLPTGGSPATRDTMQVTTRPTGGSFAPVQALSSTAAGNAATSTYDLAMTQTGRADAIWDYADGTNPIEVEISERFAGAAFAGSWSFRSRLSPLGVDGSSPKIAVDEQGAVMAAWTTSSTSPSSVQSTVRATQGAGFSAPKALSGFGASPSSAVLAAAPNGEAIISWPGQTGSDGAFYAARRRAGSESFGEVTEVVRGSSTTSPSVFYSDGAIALDDEGNGSMGLIRRTFDGSTNVYTPQAVSFDPVAPVLGSVTVPNVAVVGTAAAFSAAASDRVGPLTTAWDYGDGAASAGASPSHIYGAAGAYTVRVAVTDAAGNLVETTRPITVSPAAPPNAENPAPPNTEKPAPPLVDPGALDADGDGVPARRDCNDRDPKIKPGASEIPGNAVDENCDGRADPFPAVSASPTLTWTLLRGGNTRLKTLKIEPVRRGDVVSLRCTGKGCRRSATRTTTVKKGTSLTLTAYVSGMVLAPKAELAIKISRRGLASRIVTYAMVKGKNPPKRQQCQDAGQKTTRAC